MLLTSCIYGWCQLHPPESRPWTSHTERRSLSNYLQYFQRNPLKVPLPNTFGSPSQVDSSGHLRWARCRPRGDNLPVLVNGILHTLQRLCSPVILMSVLITMARDCVLLPLFSVHAFYSNVKLRVPTVRQLHKPNYTRLCAQGTYGLLTYT